MKKYQSLGNRLICFPNIIRILIKFIDQTCAHLTWEKQRKQPSYE